MSDKTILVTRPKGDEQALASALQTLGLHVIHEPLTEIFLHHTVRQPLGQALLEEPDAVLVTSRHGVQALALLSELRDPFLLCVGEATANAAQSLGFTRVASAGGNVQSMVDYIYDCYDAGSYFLYASGKHIRAELDTILTDMGMYVQRFILYEALSSQQLSDTLIEQLRRGQIDGVTFLSPRTAQIFMSLMQKADVQPATAHMEAFCLSASVAEQLTGPWKAIHVAAEATLASMVDCVDNAWQVKR